MSDPYNYPFIKRDNTMYLSTINKQDFPTPGRYFRQSSFQLHDIAGTQPKVHAPRAPSDSFALSTFVEPVPDRSKHIRKSSNPLYIDDIEGSRPRVSEFRTRRVVDPLCPKYQLPTTSEIVPDNGRNFIRDTLQTSDISGKKTHPWQVKGREPQQPIEGSSPSRLTKEVKGVSRLQVKDINKDGIFESKRNTDPQHPEYYWRDGNDKQLNRTYGPIPGTHPSQIHPKTVTRPNNLNLGIKDIQGTQAGSFFARSHFVDKRRQFRNYMITQDIQKAHASSLPKGIVTKRTTNPLMPNYQFPGHKETSK